MYNCIDFTTNKVTQNTNKFYLYKYQSMFILSYLFTVWLLNRFNGIKGLYEINERTWSVPLDGG